MKTLEDYQNKEKYLIQYYTEAVKKQDNILIKFPYNFEAPTKKCYLN